MKRIISLLLACMFLLTALVACAPEPEETQKPTAQQSETTGKDIWDQDTFVSAVPKGLSFDGQEIMVLTRGSGRVASEFEKLDAAADSSELDMAIEKRNDEVEMQLELSVIYEKFNDFTNFDNYTKNYHQALNSSVETYDVVAHFAYAAAYLDIRDTLANMMDKTIFPYFDFTKPCWNQAMVKNLSANNKLFLIAGDMNLSLFDTTMIIWHNKDLYDNMKSADDPDLQDLALEGLFTYDILYSWADRIGSENVEKSCQKTYGFGNTTHFFDTLPHAWDLSFVTQAADGTYQFNVEGNIKAENALTDVRDLMSKKGVISHHVGSALTCSCDDGYIGHFANGTIVFLCAGLYNGEEGTNKIRDMEDKYCVLPIPKYYDDQKSYGTTSADNYNLMSCVRNATVEADGGAISAWFQLMTEKSYTDVRGLYIEGIVKPRYLGTDDSDGTVTKSIELLDEILDNVEYDLATVYSASLNDIGWLWRDLVSKTPTLEEAFLSNNHSNGGVVKTKEEYMNALNSFNSFIFS